MSLHTTIDRGNQIALLSEWAIQDKELIKIRFTVGRKPEGPPN
jgi:hypothetical protein